MSNYTVTTNFGAKDSLPSGNAAKVIKGSEFTTEFTNIQTAVATKADTAGDTFTGAVTFDAAVTLNADVTFDTNTLFVDVSANRVGIGNVAPATALDVTGVITTDGLTSSAGIDVTGTIVGDGLTISSATANVADLRRANNTGAGQVLLGNSDGYARLSGTNGSFDIFNSGNTAQRFGIANNGDISFYEDTGATAKLFWDASAESLGIGTTSPTHDLHVSGTGGTVSAKVEATDGSQSSLDLKNNEGEFRIINNSGTLQIYDETDSAERMRIDSSGFVGIGETNPNKKLHIKDGDVRIESAFPRLFFTDTNNNSDL